jgi:hypothetical protein
MRTKRLLLVLSAALLTSSCGYALVGRGINVNPDIKRIGVPLFKDATGRPGLDQKVTQAVIEELLKRGHFDVVPESTGVDAVVEGELTAFSEQLVGLAGTSAAAADLRAQGGRYAITLVARVKYSKVGASEPIWSTDNFSRSDSYDAPSATENLVESDQAIDRLVSVFARDLVGEMLEAF